MNDTPRTHPHKNELVSFGQGKLAPDESIWIEKHLEKCPDCCETMLGLDDDTFVALVRNSPPPTGTSARQDATIDHDSAATSCTASVSDLPDELREHGRYEIVDLIGRGGMGDVYKAQHKVMNRPVALKVIKAELVQNEAAVERFRREVQAAARLHDRNIVTAYDAEQAGDLHFLVMEFVDGVNLDEVIRQRGPLSVDRACDYIRQAATGLQHAHELGMVHRDIKPHNLMLASTGEVKILDFGLANFASEAAADELREQAVKPANIATGGSAPLTQAGTVMGTPDYIAPEQARDAHTADIRADVYSLGCTFYALLAGRAPFAQRSLMEKIKAHTNERVPPLSHYRDDVPLDIDAILQKMMAKDPAERYQTPAAVVAALSEYGLNAPEVKTQRALQPARIRQRRRALIALSSLMVATVFAAMLFYLQTDYGLVRVEVTDPSLEVVLNDKTIEVKDGQASLSIRAGEQKLVVRRGGNFEFETEDFQLRRGDKVVLKVDVLDGVVVVAKDDQRIAAKALSELSGTPAPGNRNNETALAPEDFPIEQVHRLRGHRGKILALAFLDNTRFVSVGEGGEVRLWDAQQGRQIDVLAGHIQTVHGVAAARAAGMFATGDHEGQFLLWNDQGASVGAIEAPSTGRAALALSPDGSRLFTVGDGDKLPRIWNTRTRQLVHELDAKGTRLRAGAFTHDGKRLVTGGDGDTLLYIWDVKRGNLESTIDVGKNTYSLATAADNRTVAGGAYQAVVLVDLEDQKVTYRRQRNLVRSVAFLPDGRHVVSGSDDKTWRVWSLSHDREVTRVTGDKQFTQHLAVSPNGKLVAAGGGQFYDPATKTHPADGDFDIRVWKLPESLWPQSPPAWKE